MNIVKQLDSDLHAALAENYQEAYQNLDQASLDAICFEAGTNPEHGDFSSSFALKLSKQLKKNPREIAETIKTSLQNELIAKIEILGPGFLNVFLTPDTKAILLNEIIANPETYGAEKSNNKKVLVEFVSSNPTGPLHVGHGRGAILGNALANLFENSGCDVTKEYYVNDAGRQISILSASVLLNAFCSKFESEGTYEGEYIKSLSQSFKETVSSIAINLDIELNQLEKDQRLDKIIEQLSNNFPEHWEKARKFSVDEIIQLIKSDLKNFNVIHDEWFFESSVGKIDEKGSHLNNGLSAMTDKKLTFKKDGATWFKSTNFGDDKDRVLVRDNGEPTYFMTDIAYHNNKIKRGYDLCVNIFGADHHGYVSRLSSAFNALKSDFQELEVMLYQLVSLYEDGKQKQMSTRKGEFYSLKNLYEELGSDAIKFFFLEKKSDHTMDFDINKAKEANKNNPYFYTQYAHVRCASILSKAKLGKVPQILDEDINNNFNLINNLINFPNLLKEYTKERSPHSLVHYLKEVSSQYHSFYENFSVLSDDSSIQESRLAVTKATQIVINRGLLILGVEPLKEM